MKVGIVITCRNVVQLTAAAVQSIESERHELFLVVVDDFSTDGTKRFLAMIKAANPTGIEIVIDPQTASLAEKWNIGATMCWERGCDVALICNNDIVFAPCTIDALVERISKGDVGMVTAHNIRGQVEGPQDLQHPKYWKSPENPTEARSPDFSCFMITKATWDTVGAFDPEFIPCYFEDGDYHMRMGKAGIKAITTTAAPYYHYGSMTQNSVPGGRCPGPQFDRLREYLRSKHGTVPGEPEYDRICNLPWEASNA